MHFPVRQTVVEYNCIYDLASDLDVHTVMSASSVKCISFLRISTKEQTKQLARHVQTH